eukprot:scaffold63820_cov69-Phaeocystis_antarctica.AAC.3
MASPSRLPAGARAGMNLDANREKSERMVLETSTCAPGRIRLPGFRGAQQRTLMSLCLLSTNVAL